MYIYIEREYIDHNSFLQYILTSYRIIFTYFLLHIPPLLFLIEVLVCHFLVCVSVCTMFIFIHVCDLAIMCSISSPLFYTTIDYSVGRMLSYCSFCYNFIYESSHLLFRKISNPLAITNVYISYFVQL